MATRSNTTEWAFETNTASLAAATRRDLTAITIYIPESSPTFTSVVVEANWSDDATAAQTVTSYLIGIKLGAVAFDDVTVTSTLTNSAEAQSYCFQRDVTSYFTTNWTGTSMTCQVGLQIGGAVSQNHCARVLVSYTYSDAGTTRIKTLRFPIESTRATLTTSWQTVGGATAIPALTGGSIIMPEASVTVRQAVVLLTGNTASTGGTDFTVEARINGGAAQTVYDHEGALASAVFMRTAWDITSTVASRTAAHSLEMQTVTTTSVVARIGGEVVVTYEYDESTTTRAWQSLLMPFSSEMFRLASNTDALQQMIRKTVWVEEPGTITLQPSAIVCHMSVVSSATVRLAAGNQAPTAFAISGTGFTSCGGFTIVARIDAGGTIGTDFGTLARGENVIDLRIYQSGGAVYDACGYLLLNYTSDVHADGTHVHNHSIHKLIAATTATTTINQSTTAAAIAIPETEYFINSIGTSTRHINSADSLFPFSVNATRETGDGGEVDGWVCKNRGLISSPENGQFHCYMDWTNDFERWPNGANRTGMDPEVSRTWLRDGGHTWWHDLDCWVTYHAITYTAAGTITNADGTGSGITVVVHDDTTKAPLVSTTSTAGGAYSVTWYDDVGYIFAQCRQDDSHVGRSARGLAS